MHTFVASRSILKLFCAISYLIYIYIYYKTKFLKSHGAGYRYFKGKSTVNLDIFCCEKAVALPNKKIIIIRRIWRFLGMKPFQRNVIS